MYICIKLWMHGPTGTWNVEQDPQACSDWDQ